MGDVVLISIAELVFSFILGSGSLHRSESLYICVVTCFIGLAFQVH